MRQKAFLRSRLVIRTLEKAAWSCFGKKDKIRETNSFLAKFLIKEILNLALDPRINFSNIVFFHLFSHEILIPINKNVRFEYLEFLF